MRKSRILCALALTIALAAPSTAVHAATTGETQTATLYVLDPSKPGFPSRGTDMARQSAGIILNPGAVLEARVTNFVSVDINALATDSRNDVSVTAPAKGDWVRLTAKAASAVFFKLRDSNRWATAPQVEFRVVSGTSQPLPEYTRGSDEKAFVTEWETSGAPYAVISDSSQTVLLDRVDLPVIKGFTPKSAFPTLDAFIDHYRLMIATYDEWAGITSDPNDQINGQSEHRYFLRPDTNGSGWAYYSPHNWVAINGSSLVDFLNSKTGWGVLHEYAHGYDTQYWRGADNADISLGEVYNNVFTHFFQEKIAEGPLRLYPNGKDAARAGMEKARVTAGDKWNINTVDGGVRLQFMLRMIELTGLDNFAKYAQDLRALQASGTNPTSLRINDRLNHYLGANNGLNFTAWFEMNGLTLSTTERAYVMDTAPAPLPVPLNDIIDDTTKAASIAKQVGADSIYRLVTPKELAATNLTTTVTLSAKAANAAEINGRSVSLWDGTTRVASAQWANGTATFTNVPVGAYTVRAQYSSKNVLPESGWVLADVDGAEAVVDFTKAPQQAVGSTTIKMNGLGDWEFATVRYDDANAKITLRDHMIEPHSYFGDEYAHVSVVSPAGETVFSRDFIGAQSRTGQSVFTADAPVGTTIVYRHAEGGRTIPVNDVTGEQDATLKVSGKASVVYVVTAYGLEKQSEPGTALPRYIAGLTTEIAKLQKRVSANPNGYFAPEAAALISVMRSLPTDDYIAQVQQSGIFLDQLVQASRR